MIGRGLALAALAALAACAVPPAGPAAGPAAAIAAPASIDGRYRGIARLVRATIRGCPRSGSRVVTVEGNALSLNYRGATVSYALAAVVGPDGGIHGSDGRGTIDGQITGRHMDLTVASEFCEVRYALERVEGSDGS
jgi:hypothetical protein